MRSESASLRVSAPDMSGLALVGPEWDKSRFAPVGIGGRFVSLVLGLHLFQVVQDFVDNVIRVELPGLSIGRLSIGA